MCKADKSLLKIHEQLGALPQEAFLSTISSSLCWCSARMNEVKTTLILEITNITQKKIKKKSVSPYKIICGISALNLVTVASTNSDLFGLT